MEAVSRYLLSVICAAVLGGVLSSLVSEKTGTGAIIRFSAGVFLTITVIQPLVRFDFTQLESFLHLSAAGFESPAEEGKYLARQTAGEIIKTEAEAYILDKAHALGAELEVEVELTDEDLPVPCSATIRGSVSAYAKAQLERVLTQELGIAKENQQWI